ncbi:Asp23/Gls24 family envelope stress response protein [Mycetocola spongiae]|uniref:Asp23/Gls24 family envelope stress response protein n=1 Tax=Mycetocola spongiae TaxID=2859226 RepID=UPI001CF28C4A|nr:Asp23/Gls24 family envelope stress response protein [Mycetocola spongiae]UCR88119.1 Asp23/Gls24 family envelope stress response protein [Mycetocola spongiae]
MANAQNPITPATLAAATAGPVTGNTVIEDGVIAKVVGIAVREVNGVYGLGGGVARVIGAVRDAVGNTDLSQGVSVEVGETEVAVDVSLVAAYPVPLQKIADEVRHAAAKAITDLVGMSVAEVNVTVSDVHIPSDDDQAEPAEPAEARVR